MTKSKLWTKNFILGTIINFLLVLNYYLLMVIMENFLFWKERGMNMISRHVTNIHTMDSGFSGMRSNY